MNETPNYAFRIDDPYEFLSKELLEQEYLTNKLTDKQIAQKYGIGSKTTVWRRRQFFHIANSHPNKTNNNASVNRTVSFLREDAIRWRQEGLDYFQIADLLKCSRISVCRRYKEMGLVKGTTQAQNKLRWHVPLTVIQEKFLLGTLLGDGNITRHGMFQCNHSIKQKEYIQYKTELLTGLLSPNFGLKSHWADDGTGKKHEAMYLRTMQNENLKIMHDYFYKDNVKIFPADRLFQSLFDEFSLAIWFMDDGGRSGNSVNLFTFAFGYAGNLAVLDFLYKKFGVCGELKEKTPTANTSKDCCHYVHFSPYESKKFCAIVFPHMLPSMRYKLPGEHTSG